MYKDGIDTLEKAQRMINYCRNLGGNGKRKVQLTMRPVVCWDNHSSVFVWTKNHIVEQCEIKRFYKWAKRYPTVLRIPPEGRILDIDGQNLCITDCLTTNESTEEMRQIILYPDGTISYDWKYEGAFLM
jgi:hypothetical protein